MVDYIAKLERLFNQLAGAGEKQSEKEKLYVLLANLPIQYHSFRTAISNSPNFENIKYDDTCDRLILEHQQLIGDSGKPPGGTGGTSGAFLSRVSANKTHASDAPSLRPEFSSSVRTLPVRPESVPNASTPLLRSELRSNTPLHPDMTSPLFSISQHPDAFNSPATSRSCQDYHTPTSSLLA